MVVGWEHGTSDDAMEPDGMVMRGVILQMVLWRWSHRRSRMVWWSRPEGAAGGADRAWTSDGMVEPAGRMELPSDDPSAAGSIRNHPLFNYILQNYRVDR